MDEKTMEVLRIEIARLDVRPGECLLIRVPDEMLTQAHECAQHAVPSGVKVLVAPFSVEFSVISQPE